MPSIIVNGHLCSDSKPSIMHNDRGFLLGHGLFETMLVKNGHLPALDYHWQRLVISAPWLDIVLPFSCHRLESMVQSLLKENHLQNEIVAARVTVTHGNSERGIFPSSKPRPNFLITTYVHSQQVIDDYSALVVDVVKNEHALTSRIKSTSYLEQILAKRQAFDQNYHEAILLNTASNVADGAVSNVFIVKNEQIITPRVVDGALPGVVRAMLLNELRPEFKIIEQSISMPALLDADEVFITNALMGVQPIVRLNAKTYTSFITAQSIGQALRDKKNYI